MKIIGGIYKGIKLYPFPGKEIRPTPAIIREAIFNIVAERIVGQNFLDLFSGTGAMGIEAISRGAGCVTFVDIDKNAISLIKKNLNKINIGNNAINIIKNDYFQAIKLLNLQNKVFDIIFFDPPYDKDFFLKVLQLIDENPILKELGIIIVQHPSKMRIENKFNKLSLIKENKYGNSKISVFIKNN